MNPETEREAAAPAVLPDAGGEGAAAPRDPRDARLDELSRELVLRDNVCRPHHSVENVVPFVNTGSIETLNS